MRPKRLFHAVVVCGISLTACGGTTSETDAGGVDATPDVSKKPPKVDGSLDPVDAGQDASNDVAIDASDFDAIIIMPPPIK